MYGLRFAKAKQKVQFPLPVSGVQESPIDLVQALVVVDGPKGLIISWLCFPQVPS